MYLQSDFEENKMKLLRELGKFFDISEHDKRLRPYTINVIGSGNIAVPYVQTLARMAIEHDSIKRINWWKRQQKIPCNSDTTNSILYYDLKQSLNGLFSDRIKGSRMYDILTDKVKVIGYDSSESLREIVETSKRQNPALEADMTVILANFDTDFLFDKKNLERERIPKTLNQLKHMGKSRIMLYANTLFHKNKREYNACLDTLVQNQSIILDMHKLIEDYSKDNNISQERLKIYMVNSLFGNKTLAQTLEGYTGTIINMSTPIEIINHQFASHSNIPVNKIFSPIDNDYCRLQVILKEAYRTLMGRPFIGDIRTEIVGDHNELMTFNRNKTFFGDKKFDEIFRDKNPDAVFNYSLEKVRNFGCDYLSTHGKTSVDTVYNSLLTATAMLVNEHNSMNIHGCIYNKDYKIFTGGGFRIQRGIAIPKLIDMDSIDKDISKEFNKSIEFNRGLISKLKSVDGLFGKYEPRFENVPDIDEVKEVVFDEKKVINKMTDKLLENGLTDKIIEGIQQSNGKVAKIKFTAYFKSSENRLAVNKYTFNGSNNPEITRNQFTIKGDDIIYANSELKYTQLHSFDVQNNKLVILAERSHSRRSTDYYLSEYKNSSQVASYKINFDPRSSIKQLVLNKHIYLLAREQDGQSRESQGIYIFDNTIHKLGKTPKEFTGIMPYHDSIIGFSGNEIYQFNEEWNLLATTENIIDSVVKIDSKNNILYYLADTDDNVRTFVAQDLDQRASRNFSAANRGFYPYSDNNGIQVWTILDNKIQCSEYDSKKGLYTNDGKTIIMDSIPLKRVSIWSAQRDIAALDNSQYINSIGKIHGDSNNKYFGLIIKNNNHIYHIPVTSMQQYDPAGGIFT